MNKLTPEIISYIQDHIDDDLPKLILKKGANTQNIDYSFAFQQIGARQKAKNKLPEWYANFHLVFPSPLSVEQSSSQQTAQYKTTLLKGDHLIDLSAGFGVDAFYLSSNFNQTTLVDTNPELCDILLHNASALHLDSIKVINANAENYLEQIDLNSTQKITFYIDPARRGKQGEKLIDLGDCEPNILNIKDQLLTLGEKVCIKLSPMIDLKQLLNQLSNVVEIHVVSVHNECKEILAILERNPKSSELKYVAVNLKKGGIDSFEFINQEEKESIPTIAEKVENYLYEPNSAIMKSGCFKLIGERYNLSKIALNSHLYTSNQHVPEFPGRIFKVEQVLSFQKDELKKYFRKGEAYNLAIRNFPMDTENLKKQLRIKDGGDKYLFATTMEQKHILIICTKT